MSPPRIGELRHRLRIEAPQRSDDALGGASVAWNLMAEVWAAVRPVKAGEDGGSDKLAQRTTFEVWMRPVAGLSGEHRLAMGARVLSIKSVVDGDGGRGRWLKVIAEEVGP